MKYSLAELETAAKIIAAHNPMHPGTEQIIRANIIRSMKQLANDAKAETVGTMGYIISKCGDMIKINVDLSVLCHNKSLIKKIIPLTL